MRRSSNLTAPQRLDLLHWNRQIYMQTNCTKELAQTTAAADNSSSCLRRPEETAQTRPRFRCY
jgi:hypothetical protein